MTLIDQLPIDLDDLVPYGPDPIVSESGGVVTVGWLSTGDYASDYSYRDVLGEGWEFTTYDSRTVYADAQRPAECAECGYDEHEHNNPPAGSTLEEWLGCSGFVPNDLRKAIDAGRAFRVEKYEHGLVRYALVGESSAVDRQWDVVGLYGWLIADDQWNAEPDQLEQWARHALDAVTNWANGQIWSVNVATYERKPTGAYTEHFEQVFDWAETDIDSVSGFFTEQDAISELQHWMTPCA